jgi:hypothetical protein
MLRMLFRLQRSVKQWGFDYDGDYTSTQRALKEYREHLSHKIQSKSQRIGTGLASV